MQPPPIMSPIFYTPPSNIIRKSYLWCRGHPIGMALAAGRGELWSRTPLPCEDVEFWPGLAGKRQAGRQAAT